MLNPLLPLLLHAEQDIAVGRIRPELLCRIDFKSVNARSERFLRRKHLVAEKLTGDNIYKVLIYFDKLYSVMYDQEKRQLMESLLSEVQIYEERQPNGQWLKSIKFKLPIIAEDMSLSLDNDAHIETVCLLSKHNAKHHIEVGLNLDELDLTNAEKTAT